MIMELVVLLILAILGPAYFAAFEVETPGWRKALKWTLICGVTLALSLVAGHWALLFPISAAVAGLTVHFWWCTRNGIDPLRATPRRRYYELRGWSWPE
jgi:hypothetical protein